MIRAQAFQLCIYWLQMAVPDQLDDHAASQFLVRDLRPSLLQCACSLAGTCMREYRSQQAALPSWGEPKPFAQQ